MSRPANVLAVACARITSERMPGKMMAQVLGSYPVLGHVLNRLEQSESMRKIVVATPESELNAPIWDLATSMGHTVVVGPEHDVVARMEKAVERHAVDGDLIYRVMTDQPFLDWNALDSEVSIMQAQGWDFVLPLTFSEDPVYGASAHLWTRRVWHAIANQSRNDEREHPGMWLRRHLGKFNYGLLDLPHWAYRPYRLELDTEDDLKLCNILYGTWTGQGPPPLRWVVQQLDRNPSLAMINGHVRERTGTYTSFTKAEIEAWHRDYAERSVVWSDVAG
ncbi:hypothetical protein LCGC14_1711920, partial [marine sediment metagenome]